MVKSAKNLKTERDVLSRAVYLFTLASFLFALVYLFLRAVGAESSLQSGELRIIIFQLVMGCVFLRLPYLISRVTRARIPTGLSVGYFAFLWCAIFLGEFALFYYRVSVWDSLLHLFSAALAALAALSIPSLLGVRGQPLISLLVAIGAALTLGVAWEIYEFAFDGILGLNMQKFASLSSVGDATVTPSAPAAESTGMLSALFGGGGNSSGALSGLFGGSGSSGGIPSGLFGDGSGGALSGLFGATKAQKQLTPLVGRDALADTMTDLILDLVGAAAVGIWGYLRVKRHGDLPPSVKITREEG